MTVFEQSYEILLPNHPTSEIFFNESVTDIISEATFESDQGEIRFSVDWQKAVDDFMMYDPTFKIPCMVQSPTDHIGENDYYVQYYLYQVFLAFNLSLPGQGTFFRTTFHPKEAPTFSKTLELKGYEGHSYTLNSGELWPDISLIPLRDTWNWLQSLCPNFRQVAESRTERALFAMLHVSKNDSLSPASLIWSAHALEALFDTPDQGIIRTLKDRIYLVLGQPTSHSRSIKQDIDSFYRLRSTFVHGTLGTAHPLGDPTLHDEVKQLQGRIIKEANLAISIIWATLQLLVRNNWRGILFSESFNGLDIQPES